MLLGGEEPGPPLLPEPVAFSPDVEHVAVVQQPGQDGRGNHGGPQHNSPHSPKPLLEVRMMEPRS